MTYPSLVPYFKGIHLTLDSWRENRDAEGWRIHNYCVTKKISYPILFYRKLGIEGIVIKSISKEEVDEEKKEEKEEKWEEKESRSSENLAFFPTKTPNAPERVHAVPRLRHAVQGLMEPTESLTPPERHV